MSAWQVTHYREGGFHAVWGVHPCPTAGHEALGKASSRVPRVARVEKLTRPTSAAEPEGGFVARALAAEAQERRLAAAAEAGIAASQKARGAKSELTPEFARAWDKAARPFRGRPR